MCLIVHRALSDKGKGANVPNAVLNHNRTKNPDGFGVAWRDTKGVHAAKWGPKEYNDFHKAVKTLDKNRDIEYVAHFRFATHGVACKALSHPFEYKDPGEGTVLVFHNGIIDIKTDRSKVESDTSVFVKEVISGLPSRWWANPSQRLLVEMAGGWSRLLIMTDRETVRMGSPKWINEGGIWYSTDPMPYTSAAVVSYSGKGWQDEYATDYGAYVVRDNEVILPDGVTWAAKADAWNKGDKLAYSSGWTPQKAEKWDRFEAEQAQREFEDMLEANEVPRRSWRDVNPAPDGLIHQAHVVALQTRIEDEASGEGDFHGAAQCETCSESGEYWYNAAAGDGDVGEFYVGLDHEHENPRNATGEWLAKPLVKVIIPRPESALVAVALQN